MVKAGLIREPEIKQNVYLRVGDSQSPEQGIYVAEEK